MIDQPDRDRIKALAEKHIRRYVNRIERGRAGQRVMGATVNIKECQRYLNLWCGMESKDFEFDRFSLEERAELFDALADEEGYE